MNIYFKRSFLVLFLFQLSFLYNFTTKAEADTTSPTEDVLTHSFISEEQMKNDLLQMLANSMGYARDIWFDCQTANSAGESCGYFKANSAGNSKEDGVRTNADFSMLCAFLYKYAQGKVTLPDDMTWPEIKKMAINALVFGYSTHKSNKLKVTSDNTYWGSVSGSDHVWESSLWTMSLAYASYFLADELTSSQKTYIYNMIKAECNYELNRNIPTGYIGDTKAEENGWEADVLACALGLYPNDELATQWFDRLRLFAINSYSHKSDANDGTVIDQWYDNKTVKDLYMGQNLYDDYTLQNHNYFHTSYQNVVIQELGEAYLAMKLFQGGNEKWRTNSLMHNNQQVMDKVLNQLALADGELAMPNGNDWSMFLYDQITSYSTMACFMHDPNALMLENMAYKNIKARQTTTPDGSWLLNSDIGPRRMGVEGHRVMMTWLMHELASTATLTPTTWDDFNTTHQTANLLTTQNIIRAASKDRFVCFSWSNGLSSYSGYIAANSPDKNKILIPYKYGNTGNFIGYYTVNDNSTNAVPVVNGIYNLNGNSFTMNGCLTTNNSMLENSFSLYATPGNAVVYLDYIKALKTGSMCEERGGLMAVSTDPFTKNERTIYMEGQQRQSDGSSLFSGVSSWANIDNAVGFITTDENNQVAFGDRTLTNSIYTSKLYTHFSNTCRSFKEGSILGKRTAVYYSNITADETAKMQKKLIKLTSALPDGWNGIIAPDPDGVNYLILSNFEGKSTAQLKDVVCAAGAPIFTVPTTIIGSKASATFTCKPNNSVANTLCAFVRSENLTAQQVKGDSTSVYLTAGSKAVNADVSIISGGNIVTGSIDIAANETKLVLVEDGKIHAVQAVLPKNENTNDNKDYTDVTTQYLKNFNFEEDSTYGTINENGLTVSNTNYTPCYTNSVTAVDSKWPNILPVSSWNAGNTLNGGSKYCRMYSMPYSENIYCVSPSTIGNYSSICSKPLDDDSCGVRCLTVLNSWDKGANQITQKVTLPKGNYRLLMDALIQCNSISSRTASTISSGTNLNSSLCGVSYGNVVDFRYPTTVATWDTLQFDFNLDQAMPVTFSVGYSTSTAVGAANNTLLYIDNLRLLQKNDATTNIVFIPNNRSSKNIYTLDGELVGTNVSTFQAQKGKLKNGIYIYGNKKIALSN